MDRCAIANGASWDVIVPWLYTSLESFAIRSFMVEFGTTQSGAEDQVAQYKDQVVKVVLESFQSFKSF